MKHKIKAFNLTKPMIFGSNYIVFPADLVHWFIYDKEGKLIAKITEYDKKIVICNTLTSHQIKVLKNNIANCLPKVLSTFDSSELQNLQGIDNYVKLKATKYNGKPL